jgi:hypothetical protein
VEFVIVPIKRRDSDEKETALSLLHRCCFVCGIPESCRSQCEELRQELIKDCRNDLGPNNERCREDQKRFQEICHDESLFE